MKREIDKIQNEMLAVRNATPELSALEVLTDNERQTLVSANSGSRVSVWRLFIYVVAVAHYVQRQLWRVFRNETEKRIEATRPHTLGWYREKALAFRMGMPLIAETDKYSDSGYTEAQIQAAKIIKHAAIEKRVVNGYGQLRAKLAKEESNELVPLSDLELAAVKAYFEKVADAGSVVLPTSNVADDLKLEIDYYYDPLILNSFGQKLSGGQSQPAVVEIQSYLKSLKFNGRLILEELEDHLKKNAEGAIFPKIKKAWSKYGNYTYESIGANVGLINEIRVADAGYMRLDLENTIINYIPYNDGNR